MGVVVSVNGKITRPKSGAVSPGGQGFLYGFGLFETMPAYTGRIYRLDKHLERLVNSAATLGIERVNGGLLEKTCSGAAVAAGEDIARIRLTVARRESGDEEPDIVVIARRYDPPAPSVYRQGCRAIISPFRRSSFSPLVGHKTTSRMECVMARDKALKEGYDEALFINEKGNLTEGSISNLFMVASDGILVTPPLAEGLLPGIMRQMVIDSALELGIAVSQTCVPTDALTGFSSAFLTNSMFGILPLSGINIRGTEHKLESSRTIIRLIETWREATGQGPIPGLA